MFGTVTKALLCASGLALLGNIALAEGAIQTTPTAIALKSGELGIDGGISRDVVQVTADSAVALSSDAPFSELSIANPEIADISTISSTSIYVLGKRPGRTTLMLLGSTGEIMRVIDIRVSPDVTEFKARLSELLPGENLDAVTANDGIVLLGTVSSQGAMEQALELAGHYATGKISNLIKVEEPEVEVIDLAGFEPQLRRLLPGEDIRVDIKNGNILIAGSVASDEALTRATELAEAYAPGRVTSFLAVEAPVVVTPEPDIEGMVQTLTVVLPTENLLVHEVADAIILSGTVSSEQTLNQALEVARLFSEGTPITNMLTVAKVPSCVIKTRKGGETIEMNVRCSDTASGA